MEGLEHLVAEATMGEAATTFWKSDVGRYVLGRIQEDIDMALGDLAEVDPTNTERIRKLQSDIAVAKRLPVYLSELITQGNQAQDLLDEAGSE